MKNTYILDLDGISVTVEKKPIRNMYLRVQPPDGRVLLTAPLPTPDAVVERFARQRLPWIRKHRQTYDALPAPVFAAGETVCLWGELYLLDVRACSGRAKVVLSGRMVTLFVPVGSDAAYCACIFDGYCRRVLAEAIQAAAPACERTVGKHAFEWKIRDMKSRWGTCNTRTAAITLNLQLVKRDPRYLHYVMIHELTHLHEPSHNARFYSLMDGFLPEWKQLRRSLKEHM